MQAARGNHLQFEKTVIRKYVPSNPHQKDFFRTIILISTVKPVKNHEAIGSIQRKVKNIQLTSPASYPGPLLEDVQI